MANIPAISGLDDATQARVVLFQSGRQVHAPVLDVGLQPLDPTLTAIAALTGAADKGIYFTGADVAALFDLSSFARTFLDDTSATAVLTTLGITWGTYTPTGANIANCDSVTGLFSLYLRIGDRVIVGGEVTVDFTAGAGTVSDFRLSLPIASNIGASTDAVGSGANSSANAAPMFINGDVANDAFFCRTFAPNTSANTYSFIAMYRVI